MSLIKSEAVIIISTAGIRPRVKAVPAAMTEKPRRVRTGCLTCRERHLKCDEAVPCCQNCRKSHRVCKRGVKLNFLDITVHNPSEVPPFESWEVDFLDESLDVAAEYRGGLSKYTASSSRRRTKSTPKQVPCLERGDSSRAAVRVSSVVQHSFGDDYQVPNNKGSCGSEALHNGPGQQYQPSSSCIVPVAATETATGETQEPESWPWWSPSNDFDPAVAQIVRARAFDRQQSSTASTAPQPTHAPSQTRSPQFEGGARLPATPPDDATQSNKDSPREYLHEFEEVAYMEVFVDEVGVWMDCFDQEQQFAQHLPFRALKTPMLLNALLACGALHLSMADHDHSETASIYYDTATSQLLRNLQNPERNTEECAAAAVVLNVYEAMTDKPPHRMSHVAGARALIKECGWNATSSGIGSACFWLNVGMEVLDCLATNLPTTWDPNDWGIDMNFSPGSGGKNDCTGDEQIWVHRMFYVVANIANFRASSPPFQDLSPHAEQIERSNRLCEWQKMKRICDRWNNACPRSMHPMGYLNPPQSKSSSCFPRIWLLNQHALLGRLLYHMGQCILAQTNPLEPAGTSKEMTMLQLHHAHQICGIVAHSRDPSLRTVAVKSIEIAAPSLMDQQEQIESLRILKQMNTRGSQWLRNVVCRLRQGWDQERAKQEALPIRSPVSEPIHHPSGHDRGPLAEFRKVTPTASLMQSRAASTHSCMSMSRAIDQELSPLMSRDLMEALRSADFRHPRHPYKNWWQPASRTNSIAQARDELSGITQRGLESLTHTMP